VGREGGSGWMRHVPSHIAAEMAGRIQYERSHIFAVGGGGS
jgi:hypothetical protein